MRFPWNRTYLIAASPQGPIYGSDDYRYPVGFYKARLYHHFDEHWTLYTLPLTLVVRGCRDSKYPYLAHLPQGMTTD